MHLEIKDEWDIFKYEVQFRKALQSMIAHAYKVYNLTSDNYTLGYNSASFSIAHIMCVLLLLSD